MILCAEVVHRLMKARNAAAKAHLNDFTLVIIGGMHGNLESVKHWQMMINNDVYALHFATGPMPHNVRFS